MQKSFPSVCPRFYRNFFVPHAIAAPGRLSQSEVMPRYRRHESRTDRNSNFPSCTNGTSMQVNNTRHEDTGPLAACPGTILGRGCRVDKSSRAGVIANYNKTWHCSQPSSELGVVPTRQKSLSTSVQFASAIERRGCIVERVCRTSCRNAWGFRSDKFLGKRRA